MYGGNLKCFARPLWYLQRFGLPVSSVKSGPFSVLKLNEMLTSFNMKLVHRKDKISQWMASTYNTMPIATSPACMLLRASSGTSTMGMLSIGESVKRQSLWIDNSSTRMLLDTVLTCIGSWRAQDPSGQPQKAFLLLLLGNTSVPSKLA